MADYNPGAAAEASAKGVTSATTTGMDQGTALATTYMDMQAKQAKQEEMKQQLTDMKFKSLTGTFNNAMKMSDEMFKVASPAMEKSLSSSIPGYQPGTLKAMRSDPDNRAAWQGYNEAVVTGKLPTDDAHKQLILQAAGNPGMLEELATSFNHQRQLEAAKAMKEAQFANQQTIADKNNQTKKDVADLRNGEDSPRVQRMNESVHQNALNAVTKNTGAEKALQSSANLQMALNNFENSGHAHEEFNQLQQAIRANTGINGTSTGVERANAYLNDLGMKGQGYAQFLTGNIQDVEKTSPEMVALIRNLAARDIKQKQDFAARQLKPAVTGHASFYSKPGNEGRKADFEATVNEKLAQNGYEPNFKLGQPFNFQHLGVPLQGPKDNAQPVQSPVKPSQLPPDVLHQKIKEAKEAGHSDEEIQQYLKAKGGQ